MVEAKENPKEEQFVEAVSEKMGINLRKITNQCYSTKCNLERIIPVDLKNFSFLDPLKNENDDMDLLTQLSQLVETEEKKGRDTAEKLVRDLFSKYDA